MERNKRDKGEFYLRRWGQAITEMERLQKEISNLKKGNYFFKDIYLDDKRDIEECYLDILYDKKTKLSKIIKDYKIVDDLVQNLELYQQEMLKSRYGQKKSWQAIALNVHISVRQCFNIKNKVIKEILENVENE